MQKLMEINYCHKTKVIVDHLSQMQMQSLSPPDDTSVHDTSHGESYKYLFSLFILVIIIFFMFVFFFV